MLARTPRQRAPNPGTRRDEFQLKGGLDLVTPALEVDPGRALTLTNFAPWFNGGYRRVTGYERFDGRPAPSAAVFTGFEVVDSTGMSLGDVLTGDVSGATGTVCGISGNHVAVTKVSGTFQADEGLNTGTYTITSNTPLEGEAPTTDVFYNFREGAETEYRNDIQVVPGVGDDDHIGAWFRGANGNEGAYAFRNGIVYKSSAAGWATSPVMADYIYFDAGVAAGEGVEEGDTVTGLGSGSSATVHRIVLNGGSVSWDGSGEGYLVLTNVVGAFENDEALQKGGVTFATSDGENVAFTLSGGGKYRFLNHNFKASTGTFHVYGCNGVDPAFEIDESDVVSPILFPKNPITNQPVNNTPIFIEVHRSHLFLGMPGGIVSHSVPGEPLNFSGFLDAAEFGVGSELSGIKSLTGSVLALITDRNSFGLYGKSVADWELRRLSELTGGKAHSVQVVDRVYSLDVLGVNDLNRTDQFGDFAGSTVSQLIQPLLETLFKDLNDSNVDRAANHVKFYFSDRSCVVMHAPAGLYNQVTGRPKGIEFGFYVYPVEVKHIWDSENTLGQQVTLFTSDDGYVYQDNRGRNFDGESVSSSVRLMFNFAKSSTVKKRFRRAAIEADIQSRTVLQVQADLEFSEPNITTRQNELVYPPKGGVFDASIMNEIVFDGQAENMQTAFLTGDATNVSLLMHNDSSQVDPFTITGIVMHYDIRRISRG